MNRFEAQIPYTQVFVHMSFLKVSSIQNIFKYSLLLTNSILCIITSYDQNYFEKYQDLFKTFSKNQFLACCGRPGGWPALFQVRAVDRPVDWASDRLGACMCARIPVDQTVDRTPFRSTDLRLTESHQLSVCFGRPGGRPDPISVDRPSADWKSSTLCLFRLTGRSTMSRQRLNFLKTRSTGRSTVAWFQP